MWQAERARDFVSYVYPESSVKIIPLKTTGDRDKSSTIPATVSYTHLTLPTNREV